MGDDVRAMTQIEKFRNKYDIYTYIHKCIYAYVSVNQAHAAHTEDICSMEGRIICQIEKSDYVVILKAFLRKET